MRSLIAAAALTLAAVPASAVTILEYQTAPSTSNAILVASDTGAGVTATDMEAGAGISAANGGTWNWNGWGNSTTPFNSVREALAGGDFWQWGFTSTTAYNLTSFDIRLDRSSTGPNQFDILLSVNGGVESSVLSDDFGDASSGRDYIGVDLSGFDEVTSAAFTLVAYGADSGGSSGNGTFDLETVDFFGSDPRSFRLEGDVADVTAPIPLPAGLPLLVAGLGGLALLRRRS